jgi:thiol-disulfide isomerase/thioredoxin
MEIVYIGATWCSTCKVIKPKTLELGKLYGIPVKTLDYDDDIGEEEKATITKVPTLRIMHDGKCVETWNVNQVAQLTAWLSMNVKLHTAIDDF